MAMSTNNVVSRHQPLSTRGSKPADDIRHQDNQAFKIYSQLKGKDLSLAMLGEDDSGEVSLHVRRGPVMKLTPEATLKILGFKPEIQIGSEHFAFNVVPSDGEFWPAFVDYNDRAGNGDAARQLQALLTGASVVAVATMVVTDRKAFSTPAFLVAQMRDGSVLALRAEIGGMTF